MKSGQRMNLGWCYFAAAVLISAADLVRRYVHTDWAVGLPYGAVYGCCLVAIPLRLSGKGPRWYVGIPLLLVAAQGVIIGLMNRYS